MRGDGTSAPGSGVGAKRGYHLGLLSPGGLGHLSEEALLERAKRVAEVIPLFGFYLQPAVGGRELSYDFWRAFAEIPGVEAIKIAPFDRYRTMDVVRAVCHSSRREEVALYTGNDDNIIVDLLTPFRFTVEGKLVEKRIVGGLLGQWAVWTRKAVELLEAIKRVRKRGEIPPEWLLLANQLTDANGAIFDAVHGFRGCIPGIHEVLRRQGFLEGRWCLDPEEELSRDRWKRSIGFIGSIRSLSTMPSCVKISGVGWRCDGWSCRVGRALWSGRGGGGSAWLT